jgi:hypothetical protein
MAATLVPPGSLPGEDESVGKIRGKRCGSSAAPREVFLAILMT